MATRDPQNPPEQSKSPSQAALRGLVQDAQTLEVEDILDLCYAFAHDRWRLYAYLEALRSKGGRKSQIAACLICYDLAKKGERSFQIEFAGLLPVMRQYCETPPPPKTGSNKRPVDELIGDSPYLADLLKDLEGLFKTEGDLADDGDVRTETEEVTNRIDLFEDEDWGDDFDEVLSVTDTKLRETWNLALDKFLGKGAPAGAEASFGFTGSTKIDLAGVERLCADATSLNEVPAAMQLLPLAQLYLASHKPHHNMFGLRNRARSQVLESGLTNFIRLEQPGGSAANWLLPPTASDQSWERVLTVLLDFLSFMYSAKRSQLRKASPRDLARAYAKMNTVPRSIDDRLRGRLPRKL